MSTTTTHLLTPPAPWKAAFTSHISKMSSPIFVLATLHPAPPGSVTPYLPRARTCVYRGMWAELPPNKHNTAPQNERIYESDLLTFTTDVRMQKVHGLFTTGPGKAEREEQMVGSGGGGPVEAVFWIDEVKVQWRIRGSAWVVARDVDAEVGDGGESSGVRTLKAEIGERMRTVHQNGIADWSWGKELTAQFGNCSPGMRGSWRNPPPGTPVDNGEEQSNNEGQHHLGQQVEDLEDPVARENFRVVIIKPDLVESIDLTDPTKSRRHLYTFIVEDDAEKGVKKGDWKEEILWP